jgi:S-adenosylmethionine:diacylglycerol 3-amino-3-carboxypropyl transferase
LVFEDVMQKLPPTLFNFANHNEDAAVEMLVVDALGGSATHALRVLCVAGCGTHVVTMCSSPDVATIDAVDVAPAQLQLGGLIRAAVEALTSTEELAIFLGNSESAEQRRGLYDAVRERTGPAVGRFWDDNLATIEAGVIGCGGAERCQALVREQLPSDDLAELAGAPEAVAAAFRGGMTLEALQAHIVGMPLPAMQALVEHGVPQIAAQANQRLAQCTDGSDDFMLELILRGRYPMDPMHARPLFLQPEVFAAVRQNGCGPKRLAFHQGPVQAVGAELAASGGAYDLADISNILDMAPPDAAALIVDGVKDALRPGGAVLCRSHKGTGLLAELFSSRGLKVDEGLSRRAWAAETSFFMNDVCVAMV